MATRDTALTVEASMTLPPVVPRLARLGLRVAGSLAFVAPLLTRLTVGYAFILTGRGKLADLETFTAFMASLGVPAATIQAPFVAGLEFVGGIALVLGLATRLFATALLGTMVVAILTADRANFLAAWLPTGEIGPLDVPPYVFFLLLSWLALYGPGPISVDQPLARKLGLGGDAAK
jgi:putative oxidoreductase